MRSTYGNKLGGIPRTNIPASEDEKRLSPIRKADGTRDELLDWRLYFKKQEDGGILPEYKNLLPLINENGEFDYGDILYAFRDIRLVPLHDDLNNRVTTEIAGFTLPGTWYLVADLYLYLKRDVVIESQGQVVLEEKMSGILESDILLAVGELEYSISPCENGKNSIDWYYKFSVQEIESLGNIKITQLSKNTGESVSIDDRIKQKMRKPDGTFMSVAPMAKRGTVPKGHGVLPISGEILSYTSKEITWDGFTIDKNQQMILRTYVENLRGLSNQTDIQTYYDRILEHDNPITQTIVWQTIWKAWSGVKYDSVSLDPTDVRLDDDYLRYDGALLPLEADGFPINSEFSEGYYIPRATQWLRVSKKLLDGSYPNICRGRTLCVDKLPPNDCTKVKFSMVDAKRRLDLEEYKFISKDTTNYQPIPGKPCYQGLPAIYERTTHYEYTSSKECFDGKIDSRGNLSGTLKRLFKYELVKKVDTVTEWENIIKNSIDPTCECIEISIQNPPCIDPNDVNGCNIMHSDTIYTICPDDGEYYYNNRVVPPNASPSRLEIRHIDRYNCDDTQPKIYHPLQVTKDFIVGNSVTSTDGTFIGEPFLTSSFTSSIQSNSSKQFYTDVVTYDKNGEVKQFSLIYANSLGLGSVKLGERDKDTPSKLNYSQYMLLTSDDTTSRFGTYTNGIFSDNPEDVYIMKFDRGTLRDRLDSGNFEISLMNIQDNTSIISLIDNSNDKLNNKYYNQSPYISFELVSGSLVNGVHSSGVGDASINTNYTTYGSVYPNLGIITFDANKLRDELGFNTVLLNNVDARNELELFTSISGAMDLNNSMQFRSSTNKNTVHYFARVPASAANYSNNPSFSDINNKGILLNKEFYRSPMTYITTVGMYDNQNNLLAIGKLSRPIKKTSDFDVLLEIKLSVD
jgi:hypothetical protein